jgi:RNA polymerase sigma-70 factor (ECF subfamily)
LDGREVIAVYDASATSASHFMWLEWRDGQISFIRDYRYVSYIVSEAELVDA